MSANGRATSVGYGAYARRSRTGRRPAYVRITPRSRAHVRMADETTLGARTGRQARATITAGGLPRLRAVWVGGRD